jgi:hypothetical protein
MTICNHGIKIWNCYDCDRDYLLRDYRNRAPDKHAAEDRIKAYMLTGDTKLLRT